MRTRRPRAVLYSRLSRESIVSTSIVGQAEDLHALAEREGWDVVATFTDNGKSGGKERANAQAAFDLWAAGDADILAVYAYDRWSRMGIKTLAALIEVVDARKRSAHPAIFIAAREGIESTQADWELRAAFAADMAKRERDLVSARITAGRKRLGTQGRFAGGIPPYGLRPAPRADGVGRTLEHDPEEAPIVRRIVAELLGGRNASAVARDLNADGIPTRNARKAAEHAARGDVAKAERYAASKWRTSTIRQLAVSGHLLGHAVVNGKTTRDDHGVARVVYPPLVSPDDAARLRALFAEAPDPAHAERIAAGRRKAAHMLSGIATCASCGGNLTARHQRRDDLPGEFACMASNRGVRCSAPVRIASDALRDHVAAEFLGLFGALPVLHRIERVSDAAELIEAREALAAVSAELATDNLTDDAEDRLIAQRRRLRGRITDLEADEPEAPTVELVDTGQTFAEVWADAAGDYLAQRAILMDAGAQVTVSRATRHTGPKFDPSRVIVEFGQGVDTPDVGRGEGNSRGPGHGPIHPPRTRRND